MPANTSQPAATTADAHDLARQILVELQAFRAEMNAFFVETDARFDALDARLVETIDGIECIDRKLVETGARLSRDIAELRDELRK